jgi:hypothetical protein
MPLNRNKTSRLASIKGSTFAAFSGRTLAVIK